jgi:hypothetical protein
VNGADWSSAKRKSVAKLIGGQSWYSHRDRLHVRSVDFNGDRFCEHLYGKHQPELILLPDQDAFYALE